MIWTLYMVFLSSSYSLVDLRNILVEILLVNVASNSCRSYLQAPPFFSSSEYKVVFESFQKDEEGKNHIRRQELGAAMRMVGLNPREDDLQEFINTIEFEGKMELKLKSYW